MIEQVGSAQFLFYQSNFPALLFNLFRTKKEEHEKFWFSEKMYFVLF